MSPQLIQIAECLNEANTREIKIARCLAESLNRIQELEQFKTEAGQKAEQDEKKFNAKMRDLSEQLAKSREESSIVVQGLSDQIIAEREEFNAKLGREVDQLSKSNEQAKIDLAKLKDTIAGYPADVEAIKAELAVPAAQAAAPQSFNPRGAYEPSEKYKPFDYVSSNGSSYIALVENPTQPPSKKSKQWMLVAARGAGGGVDSGGGGVSGDRYLTSSTTSNTINNGAKTFTVGTGLAYTPTQDITIVFDAAHHMHAAVTSYNSATGVLVVDVNSHTGSGTYAVWTVNVGGIGAGAIPSGGTTGQVLAKLSNANYDDAWVTLGTAAYRDVGQAAGNVLQLSAANTIDIGDGSAPSAYINLNGPDGTVYVSNDGGQLTFSDSSRTIALGQLASLDLLDPLQAKAVIVSSSTAFTAEPDAVYTIALTLTTDTVTIHDPSNTNGKGFTVIVRRGSVFLDDLVTYSVVGTVIRRIYRSGWATYVYPPLAGNYGTGVASALLNNIGTAGAPVINGGALGTPVSGTLTTCTGLPISTGVTGLGANVATAMAVNVGTAGAPVVNGGALGTPSSGTVTNLTGTASININGTVGATTASTGAFTTLNASGLTRVGTATTADALSDVLIATSATTQRGLTIQGKASQTAPLLRIVESTNNAANNGWQFDANAVYWAGSGTAGGYINQSVMITQPGFFYKWNSSTTNLFSTATFSLGPTVAGSKILAIGNGTQFDTSGGISCAQIILDKTITATGTTGAVTINKTSGAVNCAAAASSLVVTNSLVTVNSIIQLTVGTNDTTMRSAIAVAAAGSFTIYPTTAPTAETRVNFLITN